MAQTDGYNSDITSEQVQKLAELFPEVVHEGRVNFDELRATLGEDIELGEKYGLSWKGKSSVFAKIQEKTVSTLHPQPEESVDWNTTQNMFIEGDNLESLKVLHKAYYGKIKMIYIDPPYNTGNDFVYNDDFAKTRREHAMDEGLLDEEGNATRDDGLRVNTGGHKHSNWLDMMYPRLFLSRNLLRQDGVIFVSIDDNEVHNLRLMMNETFGEENFVDCIVWQKRRGGGNDSSFIAKDHEYLLVYARNKLLQEKWRLPYDEEYLKRYKEIDDRGRFYWDTLSRQGLQSPIIYSVSCPDGTIIKNGKWQISEGSFKQKLETKDVRFTKNKSDQWTVHHKVRMPSGRVLRSLINNVVNGDGTEEVNSLFGDEKLFDNPKPTKLLKQIISLVTTGDDIVADFFSGSGTFAHAVSELNVEDGGSRRWIMVQLPELTEEQSEAYKAGYKTIAEISRERVRRADAKIGKEYVDKIAGRNNALDLGFRSYILGDSNFKKWNELMYNPSEIRQATLNQINPIEDGAKDEDLLTEILLKRGISPLVEMETHENFIFIPSETLAINLSRHMTEKLFSRILATNPSQIILLDQAFRDDVNLKTNLILQAEKRNISVEVL